MKVNKAIICLLSIITGAVIGSLVSTAVGDVDWLSWLAYGVQFGVSTSEPFVLDLILVKLSLGFMFNVNLASVFGVIIALLLCRKLS